MTKLNDLREQYQGLDVFLLSPLTLFIPKKVESVLRNHVSKKLLKEIDSDIDVAIEKCLIVLDNLSSTFYDENKWKNLSKAILHIQTKKDNDNTYIYTKVLKVLKIGSTKHGAILEGDDKYQVGIKCKSFKIADRYLKAGITGYTISSRDLMRKRTHEHWKRVADALDNPIGKNLLHTYQHIELPSKGEILSQAKKLIKEGYRTNKGKILTFRHHNSDSAWKDVSSRSFVEDGIEIFEYLVSKGFLVPIITGIENGKRVVDSFSLMPSWIRKMIKIKGEPIAENDYSCLHPNIANTLYNGTGEHISHDEVAKYLGITRQEAKIEHLSFFNKKWEILFHSPLFKYYVDNQPELMENLYNDKRLYGHKITSQRMFSLEVEMMSEAIRRLNDKGIYVVYVYDCLYSSQTESEIVKQTMNEVSELYSVNTTV